MGTRPRHFAAFIEIIFNARNEAGVLLYRLEDEDNSLDMLTSLLAEGQRAGVFRAFNCQHMALAIRGASNEFLGEMHKPGASLEAYTSDIVDLFLRVIVANHGVGTHGTA